MMIAENVYWNGLIFVAKTRHFLKLINVGQKSVSLLTNTNFLNKGFWFLHTIYQWTHQFSKHFPNPEKSNFIFFRIYEN